MTYEALGGAALDYLPCRYGNSKLLFRGPRRKIDGKHIAVLGGTETYGKFIETPWPDLLEQLAGGPVANLAQLNSGVDVYLNDRTVLDICAEARATVIEMPGVQNLSNRFYAVHPRRNDRFLRASSLLKTIYRDVDFTGYHFTRHLLTGLASASPERFDMVRLELREAWTARMDRLLEQIGKPIVLLWMADHAPGDELEDPLAHTGPLFVNREMIDRLRPRVAGVVEIVATDDETREGYDRMVFSDMDAIAASEMLGPVVHKRTAETLAEVLRTL